MELDDSDLCSLAVEPNTEEDMSIDPSFVALLELEEPQRREERDDSDPQPVLLEIFDLLEDYGPIWYTAELRRRIISALVQCERRQP